MSVPPAALTDDRTDSLPPPAELPAEAQEQGHYLRAVADMAGRQRVVTHNEVYSESGIKLLDRGVRVDSRLYDRLAQHKLRESIDQNLRVENQVSITQLMQAARSLCEHDRLGQMLADALATKGGVNALLASLAAVKLPHAVAFRLTLLREQQPSMYTHSLDTALIASYLGIKAGYAASDCALLATAGLLHDVGVLHMDPRWGESEYRFTGADRRHLLAHPISAAMLVRSLGLYPPTVAQAIMEHHEAMDGSGYPQGLQGDAISAFGQVLLLAEIVASFFRKYAHDLPTQRLSLALKFNHRKYPAALCAHVMPLLRPGAGLAPQPAPQALAEVRRIVAALEQVFGDWKARSAALAPAWLKDAEERRACAMVHQRLAVLEKSLHAAGAHPEQLEDVLGILQEDAHSLAELSLLGREALWQLQRIVNTTYSQWPQIERRSDAGDAAVLDWRAVCSAQLSAQSQ